MIREEKILSGLNESLNKLIAVYCVENKCKKKDIADKLGMTSQNFYAALNGKRPVNLRSLVRILDAIDCKIVLVEDDKKKKGEKQ